MGKVGSQQVDMIINQDNTNLDQSMMKCYQLTGKSKIKPIKDFLDDLLENDVKIIFFAHHMEVLDEVQ